MAMKTAEGIVTNYAILQVASTAVNPAIDIDVLNHPITATAVGHNILRIAAQTPTMKESGLLVTAVMDQYRVIAKMIANGNPQEVVTIVKYPGRVTPSTTSHVVEYGLFGLVAGLLVGMAGALAWPQRKGPQKVMMGTVQAL